MKQVYSGSVNWPLGRSDWQDMSATLLLLLLWQSKYRDLILPIHPQHAAISLYEILLLEI